MLLLYLLLFFCPFVTIALDKLLCSLSVFILFRFYLDDIT